jgi:hypothetical protein
MENLLAALATSIRALSDSALLAIAVLAILCIAFGVWLLGRAVQFIVDVVRHARTMQDWEFRRGSDDDQVITLWQQTANSLGLHDSEVIELLYEGKAASSVRGTLNARAKRSTNLPDNGILLSPDLWARVTSKPEDDGPVILKARLVARKTPFWNHPDRTKRYNNRITVWITAWTTVLTTIFAVVIEATL